MRWTRARAGCLLAAAIAAGLYGRTLAPGVAAGDSGELIVAARDLGIPHPPGYPLWTLLGRAAALVPLGEVAWRINALAALFGAVAVGLFYLLAARVGLRRAPRAIATALFACSTIVWQSAVAAEVYTLATALFLLLALLALQARSAATRSSRADALLFFACGLACVAHQSLAAPAAALAAFVLARGFRPRRIAAALGWAALGFSVAAALPIRAAADPGVAWREGEPASAWLGSWLRGAYGPLRQNPFRLEGAADELLGMGTAVVSAIGGIAATAAALGFWLARHRARGARVVAIAAGTVPAALVTLIGFTPDAEHLAQVAPFLAPVVAAAALYAGLGLETLRRRTPPRLRAGWVIGGAALAVTLLAAHYPLCDRSGFTLPERYGRDLLAGLPRGAVLVVEGDNETFLAAYLTRVEGARPDLTLIHRRGYLFGDPYGLARVPRERWTAIAHDVDLRRLESSTVPVYYTTPPEDLARSGVRFVAEGLAYRAVPPNDRVPDAATVSGRASPDPWPRSSDLLPGGAGRYDYVTRKLAVTYSDVRAHALWREGRFEEALPWFEDAARVGFDFTRARLNLAAAAAAAGRPDLALSELLAARALDPYRAEPAARLAAFLAAAGRHRDAARWFERAYRSEPNAALASDAARAWTLAGDAGRARAWTLRAGGPVSSRAGSGGGSPDETLGAWG